MVGRKPGSGAWSPGRCPDRLKLPFALWTREAVGQVITQRTGVQLSLTAIGVYLKSWGLTPQKPIRRATERNEAAIRGTFAAVRQESHLSGCPNFPSHL